MSNVSTQTISPIESALIMGDLSKLTPDQRLSYYKSVCESVGLNSLTKPFEYIQLNGKLTLYAKRDATDQLRKVHNVSIKITTREKIDDIYIVTAQATDKTGRIDESTGAVSISGLKGDNLANAFLKAETKAKRRVTLSLCGLGLLDETEVSTIADAKPFIESQSEKNVSQINEVLIETGFNNDSIVNAVSNAFKPKESKPTASSFLKDENLIKMATANDQIVHSKDFTVTFGVKHKGKKLSDFSVEELESYMTWLKDSSYKSGKPLGQVQLEFIEAAEHYIMSQVTIPKLDTEEQIPF